MESPKTKIVLLGIGHTNAHVVKQWATEPIAGCELICISKFPTATYSGMFPGTLGWQFSDDQMRIDLQALADRAGAKMIMAETTGLDLSRRQLQFADHPPVDFDILSIGVGSMPAGWLAHLESPLFLPVKPMQTFLKRLQDHLQALEKNITSRPHKLTIVGGGIASVEIAFCLSEQLAKRNTPLPTKIEIITAADRIAADMKPRSITRIERLLQQKQIHIRTQSRVEAVTATGIQLASGQELLSDGVIWVTGATPPPVLESLGLEVDDRGFLATHKTLQTRSDPMIFAVGDAGTIVDAPAPKAGVYAVRQCPVLWNNLNAIVTGQPLQSFEPQKDFLKLVNTGDGKALLQYGWLSCHARWCWQLKTWIDKRFVQEFQ